MARMRHGEMKLVGADGQSLVSDESVQKPADVNETVTDAALGTLFKQKLLAGKVGDLVFILGKEPELKVVLVSAADTWAANANIHLISQVDEDSFWALPVTSEEEFNQIRDANYEMPSGPLDNFREVAVELDGKEFSVYIPRVPQVHPVTGRTAASNGMQISRTLTRLLAKPNCKRCYGEGIEGYRIGDSHPLVCSRKGCANEKMRRMRDLIDALEEKDEVVSGVSGAVAEV